MCSISMCVSPKRWNIEDHAFPTISKVATVLSETVTLVILYHSVSYIHNHPYLYHLYQMYICTISILVHPIFDLGDLWWPAPEVLLGQDHTQPSLARIILGHPDVPLRIPWEIPIGFPDVSRKSMSIPLCSTWIKMIKMIKGFLMAVLPACPTLLNNTNNNAQTIPSSGTYMYMYTYVHVHVCTCN